MYRLPALALILFGLMHLFIKYDGEIVTCIMCGGILLTVIDLVAIGVGVIGLVGSFNTKPVTTT